MRILFVGTVDFSLKTLEKLINLKANIVGIVTKEKSLFNSDYADLSSTAISNSIPLHFSDNINSSITIQWIQNLQPDIVFCFGWSNLLKKDILTLAPMGVVGFHPAALPQNRGRHPIIWALVLGLKSTASTFFFMDEGADTGPIISQKKILISKEDDAATLYDKIIKKAILQIEQFLPKLNSERKSFSEQDHSLANYWRKRIKNDGEIKWSMSNNAIRNLVRALTKPYVGAHCIYKGAEIKIWNVDSVNNVPDNIEPGKVLKSNKSSILVKCYDGAINIIDHEFDILPQKGEYL